MTTAVHESIEVAGLRVRSNPRITGDSRCSGWR